MNTAEAREKFYLSRYELAVIVWLVRGYTDEKIAEAMETDVEKIKLMLPYIYKRVCYVQS